VPIPTGFSTAQIEAIKAAAMPLNPIDRAALVEGIVARLAGVAEPGDGEVHRAALQEGRWARRRLDPEDHPRNPGRRTGTHWSRS
jgi:hypothetical protein